MVPDKAYPNADSHGHLPLLGDAWLEEGYLPGYVPEHLVYSGIPSAVGIFDQLEAEGLVDALILLAVLSESLIDEEQGSHEHIVVVTCVHLIHQTSVSVFEQ